MLTLIVVLTPVRIAFGLVALEPVFYAVSIGLALIPTAFMELAKLFKLIK